MQRPGTLCFVATWVLVCLAGCTQNNPLFGLGARPTNDGGGAGAGGTALAPPDLGGQGGGGSGGTVVDPVDTRIEDGDPDDVALLDVAPPIDLPASTSDARNDADRPADVIPKTEVLGTGTLLGYWSFEDGTGSSTVADRSGSGNLGFLEGLSTTKAWVAGHSGTGLEFPAVVAGTESGVRVVLTERLNSIRTFTLAAWMKRQIKNGAALWTIISRQSDNTSDEIFNLTSNQNTVGVLLPAMGGTLNEVRADLPNLDGRWIHVAATYDGQILRLYVDGVEAGSAQWANRLQSSNTPIYIGTNKNAGPSEPFEGVLDDVALYDKVLSAADIKAIFQGASPLTYR